MTTGMNTLEKFATKQHSKHIKPINLSYPAIVNRSWERCQRQISPNSWIKPHMASGHTLESLLKRNKAILENALTVIEDAYDLMGNKECSFILIDTNGFVLLMEGSEQIGIELNHLGIDKGCFIAESGIGTNALSISIIEHIPCTIIGDQHFNNHLKGFSTTAAPIFKPNGHLLGVIGIVEKTDKILPNTMAIVDLIAQNISLKVNIKQELETTNKLMNAHQATLEHMDDGLIAWSSENIITTSNKQAAILLGCADENLLGKDVLNIIRFPPDLYSCIEQKKFIERRQTTLEVNGTFIEAITTIRPLSDGSMQLLLHPLNRIRELAKQQIGIPARHTFETITATSKKMQHVVKVARRTAKSSMPTLITGEDGVGKTDIAMAIHNASEYKNGAFVSINCRTVNASKMLLDVLGKDNGPASKFEIAHGGTLFLEKIENLCPTLQTSLLKILKTGLVSRSDSDRVIPVDLQLIASTTSDLEKHVQNKTFSKHLYYEITTNVINVPALRERQDDIRTKIISMVDEYHRTHQVRVEITNEAINLLTNQQWKGNNLELRSSIERLLLNRKSNVITADDIPKELVDQKNRNSERPILTMEEVEKNAITEAWNIFDGKISDIVEALQVSRTTLWRKVKKYELDV
ncbi:PTS-dependent dihydroxyacetone kinase operon transcriptional regulator DhaR [Photobacterium leiognathi]|uniref:dihydroxyacetone kinase operon transcriptional regulator DhaR n=1 Tax=Photobacterium leiognathi TaxID=553611 RepID=UPI001EDD1EA1|nr:dihydroxyacetone kinase operon transcriptional regulator DhaR [Photobacterium leiognathi]MCG3884495.1 PTS-dependent dihydroxyacetone kinase operon transcriptional regulator DhaR [Photobacterium leiognathi]